MEHLSKLGPSAQPNQNESGGMMPPPSTPVPENLARNLPVMPPPSNSAPIMPPPSMPAPTSNNPVMRPPKSSNQVMPPPDYPKKNNNNYVPPGDNGSSNFDNRNNNNYVPPGDNGSSNFDNRNNNNYVPPGDNGSSNFDNRRHNSMSDDRRHNNMSGDRRYNNDRRNNQPRRGTRLFVGNLKSEVLSKEEFRSIFEKYGEVKEVAIHRSFGFVQFADPESLESAMEGEQGRDIGGKNIDLQRAKDSGGGRDRRGGMRGGMDRNRRQNNDRNYRDNDYRENDRRQGGYRGRDRDRSPGRDRHRNENRDRRDRPKVPLKDVQPPKNGMVVKLILLGEQQRNFAEQVASEIRKIGVPYEIGMLDGRTLGQALRDAEENKSRYALIVGRDNAQKQRITIKLLHLREESGRCPTFDLNIPRLVDKIAQCESDLGFLDPNSLPSNSNNTPSYGNNASTNALASLLRATANTNQNAAPPVNEAALSGIAQQLQSLQNQLKLIQSQPQAPAPIPTPQYSNQQPPSSTLSELLAKAAGAQNVTPHPPPNPQYNQYGNNNEYGGLSGNSYGNNSTDYNSSKPEPSANIANLSNLLRTLQNNQNQNQNQSY